MIPLLQASQPMQIILPTTRYFTSVSMINLASCIRGILCDVALCTTMYNVWYNRTLPTQEIQCSPGKSRSLFRLRPSAGASNQSKPILKASTLLSSGRREGTNQATCTSFISLQLTKTAIPMTLVKRYIPKRKVSMSDSPNLNNMDYKTAPFRSV